MRQVAPFGPYSLAVYACPGITTPSADSPYAINSPCGSLTRCSAYLRALPLCSSPHGVWLVDGRGTLSNQRLGFCSTGFPYIPVIFKRQIPQRHMGPPGVSSGYFQRTTVRYTWFGHMTDIGLYPVLRTRPDLTPPQICLPSTCRYGVTPKA